jgi:predicted O-methyltransferase YrrM
MTTIRRILNTVLARDPLTKVIADVRADALTYLDEIGLADLVAQVRRIEKKAMPGILIEAGCALGGSAIVIASAKRKERSFYIYDVFGIIPPPSPRDGTDVHERFHIIQSGESPGIGGHKYYGYEEDLLAKVTMNFARHHLPAEENNVRLVKGLFQDTLQVNEPVALAHVDGDWFESVTTCLQRITPHLVHGGALVIDDYFTWSGCRTAVDEYFADKKNEFEFITRARLHIVRK